MEIKITECPRDAMQGIKEFIPTDIKVDYLNALLAVGFDRLDFGSFVSPKAIPQMQDTAKVLDRLDLSKSKTKLLAIIANLRGAQDACAFEEISFLGFPFSISETFQQRNTNSSILESLDRVKEIQELCVLNGKELLVYISMGFGNPYGDDYNPEIVMEWSQKLIDLKIKNIALADTIGVSNKDNIGPLFKALIEAFPKIEFGAHLHSTPESQLEKIEAALDSGCNRFDSALKGFGGCPMAMDNLTGNMATEFLIQALNRKGLKTNIAQEKFSEAMVKANRLFLTN